MMKLKTSLYELFNTIVQTYEGSAPANAKVPYAVFNCSSTRNADYRDDVLVTINVYDDKKEPLSDIEKYALDLQKLTETCVQTENGAYVLTQLNRTDLDFEITQNRRREITYLAKWYNGDFFN